MSDFDSFTEFAGTPDELVRRVAVVYSVDVDELLSTTRKAHVVAARNLAFAGLRFGFGWSFPRIADYFAKDHTTVMHGLKRADPAMVESVMSQPKIFPKQDVPEILEDLADAIRRKAW